jgi:hypothetical protein
MSVLLELLALLGLGGWLSLVGRLLACDGVSPRNTVEVKKTASSKTKHTVVTNTIEESVN